MADDYFLLILTMEKCSLCSGGRIRFLMCYCPLTDDHRSDTALSECIIIVSISPPWAWKWSAGGHCPMMYRFPVSHDDSCHSMDNLSSWEQMIGLTLSTNRPVTGQASCEPEDVVCRDLGERAAARYQERGRKWNCFLLRSHCPLLPCSPLSDSHPPRSN